MSTLNMTLKTAVLASGKTQRGVAMEARIHETRLSAIIRGRTEATERERRKLAKVLGLSLDELFPEAIAS